MSETTAAPPYAVCETCGVDLPTPEVAHEHAQSTMAPVAGGPAGYARGHAYRTVNPTPQERARSRVRWCIDDAVERCMEQLDDLVRDGRLTEAEVADGLVGYDDCADAWQDWRAEDAS